MLQVIHTALESSDECLKDDVKKEIERLLKRAQEELDDFLQFLSLLFKNGGPEYLEKPKFTRAKVLEVLGHNSKRLDALRMSLASIKATLSVPLGTTTM
jgi:hypothetical protein